MRDYRKEYDSFHASAKERKRRSSRNKARRLLKKNGKNIHNLDVDHKNGNPMDNRLTNLKAIPKSKNRSKK